MAIAISVVSVPLDEEHRMHIVVTDNTSQLLLITRPILADDPIVASPVVVGGLYAGTAKTRDGRAIQVLQNGFIIQFDLEHPK